MVSETEHLSIGAGGGFDRLYRRYAVWLHRRLRAKVGADAAADIVHDTYLRVAPYAENGIQHPKAFLLQVATNLLKDKHRQEMRREGAGVAGRTAEAEAPPQFDQVLLGQIMRDMPQLYRDVFVLSRFSGMTYPEIARVLSVSVKTVEWRMARALEYCASRLDL